MKRMILILALMSNLLFAETNSMDITITDLKEAIYRLIKDVRELKASEGTRARQEIERLNAKLIELEAQQKKMLENQKITGNVNTQPSSSDLFIEKYVKENADQI